MPSENLKFLTGETLSHSLVKITNSPRGERGSTHWKYQKKCQPTKFLINATVTALLVATVSSGGEHTAEILNHTYDLLPVFVLNLQFSEIFVPTHFLLPNSCVVNTRQKFLQKSLTARKIRSFWQFSSNMINKITAVLWIIPIAERLSSTTTSTPQPQTTKVSTILFVNVTVCLSKSTLINQLKGIKVF